MALNERRLIRAEAGAETLTVVRFAQKRGLGGIGLTRFELTG